MASAPGSLVDGFEETGAVTVMGLRRGARLAVILAGLGKATDPPAYPRCWCRPERQCHYFDRPRYGNGFRTGTRGESTGCRSGAFCRTPSAETR